jgi:hypothetical protein
MRYDLPEKIYANGSMAAKGNIIILLVLHDLMIEICFT